MAAVGTPDSRGDSLSQRTVEERLLHELFLRSRIATAFLLAVLIPLRVVLSDALQASATARLLFWTIPAVVLARLGLSLAYEAFGPWMPAPAWTLCFGTASGLIGSLLGALVIASEPSLRTEQLLLVAVCGAGINSIGIQSLSFRLGVYLSFMVPNLSALAYVAFRHPLAETGVLLGLLLVVYVVALASMAAHVSRQARRVLELQVELHESAMRDSLTGLHNRRFAIEHVAREVARLRRRTAWHTAPQLGVLLVDIDHFKEVNDSHGHDVGDAVLAQIAEVLRQSVRREELAVRWGGEEFAVFVPDADATTLIVLSERIRVRVEEAALTFQETKVLRRTCSIGFTSLPADPDLLRDGGFERAVALADAALYEAKRGGRNRCVGLQPLWGPDRFEETVDVVRELGVATAVEAGLVRIRRPGEGRTPSQPQLARLVRHPAAAAR